MNQNSMEGKITKISHAENPCNHSFRNIVYSRFLFVNERLKYTEIRTIFSIVLNASQTLSLTSRAEHRLRVFEIRVLRKLCGPTGKKIIGGSRKVRNKKLHDI